MKILNINKMLEYEVVYDVSYQSLRGEFKKSWLEEFYRVIKKFNAQDNSKAKEIARGSLLSSLSVISPEGHFIRNVKIKLKLKFENKIIRNDFFAIEILEIPKVDS